jgi:hypothetical protein
MWQVNSSVRGRVTAVLVSRRTRRRCVSLSRTTHGCDRYVGWWNSPPGSSVRYRISRPW